MLSQVLLAAVYCYEHSHVLQVKHQDKWQYVAYERSWVDISTHAEVMCKSKEYGQGAVYASQGKEFGSKIVQPVCIQIQ